MKNNLYEPIHTSDNGDATSNYKIRVKREFTVRELVKDVLNNKTEWGSIYAGERFYDPFIEYSHGKLVTKNFSEDILNRIVVGGWMNGGWSAMNYHLELKECDAVRPANKYDLLDDFKTVMHKAIDAYGKEAQTLMFFEEVAELEKELCKNARGKQNHDEIAEEIADVEIMLEQIKIMYGVKESQVELIKAIKVQRLCKRLGCVNDEKS